jgi:hypothetical protein
MNPEEKYQRKYWKVLQDIKDKMLLSEDDSNVDYKVYYGILIVGHDVPSQKEEISILKKIEKEGAIKISQDKYVDEGGGPRVDPALVKGIDTFHLEILQPKFDKIYNKYKSINNKTRDGETMVRTGTSGWISKVTNNQTLAIILGGLLLLLIIWAIYYFSGINLNNLPSKFTESNQPKTLQTR